MAPPERALVPSHDSSQPGGQPSAPGTPQHVATRFVFASCQYPAGLLDRAPAGAAMQRLESLALAEPLDAVLLLGDQIYADATYGLLDPAGADDRYRQKYRDLRNAMKSYPELNKTISTKWYTTPDDHELQDNWEPGHPLHGALEAFDLYRLGNLPIRQPSGGFWDSLPLKNGHEVFLLDTRTEREPRPWPTATPPQAHIMSQVQRQALQTWLLNTSSPIRWIASPVWLLPRPVGRPAGDGSTRPLEPALCDAWPGYPASLDWLLGLIAHEPIQNIVMLCGDAHLAGHTVLTLSTDETAAPTRVDLLHCPALYAPFPFANAHPHQLLTSDTLTGATAAGAWQCSVQSTLWENGDGFVELVVQANNPHITAVFNTATAPITVRIP